MGACEDDWGCCQPVRLHRRHDARAAVRKLLANEHALEAAEAEAAVLLWYVRVDKPELGADAALVRQEGTQCRRILNERSMAGKGPSTSHALLKTSRGNSMVWSNFAATGIISFSAKERASSLRAFCSSEKAKEKPVSYSSSIISVE